MLKRAREEVSSQSKNQSVCFDWSSDTFGSSKTDIQHSDQITGGVFKSLFARGSTQSATLISTEEVVLKEQYEVSEFL